MGFDRQKRQQAELRKQFMHDAKDDYDCQRRDEHVLEELQKEMEEKHWLQSDQYYERRHYVIEVVEVFPF